MMADECLYMLLTVATPHMVLLGPVSGEGALLTMEIAHCSCVCVQMTLTDCGHGTSSLHGKGLCRGQWE